MANSHKLYDDLVDLYPLVSDPTDYLAEAAAIRKLIHKHIGKKVEGRKPSLLEFGVGNGHVLSHLTPDVDAVATDLSEGMLELSKRFNPSVEHLQGDMRTFRMKRQFDVVLIHDAIHYMKTPAELLKAMNTAKVHLRPGGLAIFMPCYVKETLKNGDVSWGLKNAPGTRPELSYFGSTFDKNPDDNLYELTLTMFVRKGPNTIEGVEDRHEVAVYPYATWIQTIKKSGLNDLSPALKKGKNLKVSDTPIFAAKR